MADQGTELTSDETHRLSKRIRFAFYLEAEQRSRLRKGRPLTNDELRRVLHRYPGEQPDR